MKCLDREVPVRKLKKQLCRGEMLDPKLILLMDIFVAALVTLNVVRMLRTGVARSWLSNIATRKHHPVRYWRQVYTGYAALAFCAATFLWAMIWPETLR